MALASSHDAKTVPEPTPPAEAPVKKAPIMVVATTTRSQSRPRDPDPDLGSRSRSRFRARSRISISSSITRSLVQRSSAWGANSALARQGFAGERQSSRSSPGDWRTRLRDAEWALCGLLAELPQTAMRLRRLMFSTSCRADNCLQFRIADACRWKTAATSAGVADGAGFQSLCFMVLSQDSISQWAP